jgi:arylsulfatase A-like enzyme
MRLRFYSLFLYAAALAPACTAGAPHNVILFVPDGLRAEMVNAANAPTMAALRDGGVAFANSHSLFPTVTTANASAFATGHYLGDTGDFTNVIYTARPVAAANDSVTPFLENDAVLGQMDAHFAGNYLNQQTLMKAARQAGLNTAAIGKLGPALILDHTDRGVQGVIADDATGSAARVPLARWVQDGLVQQGLATAPPPRGENGSSGSATVPGTLSANIAQQRWFADVFTRVVLPRFRDEHKPFYAVFWSRDPDGSQHNQGDSLNTIEPGINGPTSLAGIRNADDNLRQIRDALRALGLDATTDIIVSADHGFSTVSKQSATSASAKERYADVPAGFLPPGFLAKDIAQALDKKLWDPDQHNLSLDAAAHAKAANGLIGDDPLAPEIVVAGNGGSDLIYLPRSGKDLTVQRALAQRIVAFLLTQDYVSGIFVDSALGRIKGALALRDINLEGSAATPHPAMVVNFSSFSSGCARPTTCGVEVSDSTLQQGQGMHGSFSRSDTFNFTAAIGPAFRQGFIDTAPVSNADVGRTIAALLGIDVVDTGSLHGRVLTETFPGGAMPRVQKKTVHSQPAANGLRTVLRYQQVGPTWYFDSAGFPGRTLGLAP